MRPSRLIKPCHYYCGNISELKYSCLVLFGSNALCVLFLVLTVIQGNIVELKKDIDLSFNTILALLFP